ncbi:MAG: helix-turn-helix domain-containing protein [Candidatus Peregrinibacteria bacterium]
MDTSEKFFTAEEASKELGLDIRTIYSYIKNGKISSVKIGRNYRITETELDKLRSRSSVDSQVFKGGIGKPNSQQKQITIKEAVVNLEKALGNIPVVSYVALDANHPISLIDKDDAILLETTLSHILPQKMEEEVKPFKKLAVLIHSQGGFLDGAKKYIDVLREYAEEIYAIIPMYAKSAATAMALGADKIIMTSVAELGPLDPIIQHPTNPNLRVPARSVKDFFSFIRKNNTREQDSPLIPDMIVQQLSQQLDPYLVGAYEGALQYSVQFAKEYLSKFSMKGRTEEEISYTVDKLTEGYAAHSHPISRQDAQDDLKLNVEKANREVTEASKLLLQVYIHYMRLNNHMKLHGCREQSYQKTVNLIAEQNKSTQPQKAN